MSAWTALVAEGFNPIHLNLFSSSNANSNVQYKNVVVDNEDNNSTNNYYDDNEDHQSVDERLELFAGLLDIRQVFDESSETFVQVTRCRKLGWDYVTELS